MDVGGRATQERLPRTPVSRTTHEQLPKDFAIIFPCARYKKTNTDKSYQVKTHQHATAFEHCQSHKPDWRKH